MAARTRTTLLAPLVLAAFVSACTSQPAAPPASPTSSSVTAPSPASTATTPAAQRLRAALDVSLSAMRTEGLTEVWRGDDGATTLVQVYDPVGGHAVSSDIASGTAELVDVDSLSLPWLLADLDEVDVTEAADRAFEVTGSYGDGEYAVSYTLDEQGRIASVTVSGADVSGTGTLSYTVTDDGRAALAAASP